jgi:hypothetical protein
MHLSDSDSEALLIKYVRDQVSAAATISDQDLLRMIGGYPGTVSQWTSRYYGQRLQSSKELEEVATNANANRFAEFDELLPSLSETQRTLGIRLSLLPSTSDQGTWAALRSIVLQELKPTDLDALKRRNIIDSTSPLLTGIPHEPKLHVIGL